MSGRINNYLRKFVLDCMLPFFMYLCEYMSVYTINFTVKESSMTLYIHKECSLGGREKNSLYRGCGLTICPSSVLCFPKTKINSKV